MSWSIGYVDDDALYARALGREVAPRGAKLTHFGEPAALLQALEEEPTQFDVLLVDLNMADTGGVVWGHAGMQVVRAVRNVVGGRSTVCVLSGMDGAFLRDSCKVNGADDFIEKDLGLKRVAAQILSHVHANPGKPVAARAAAGAPAQ